VIAPGDPERSVLLYRLATEGSGHMPYLGSRLVDARGLLLVRNWIAGLEANLGTVTPTAAAQRAKERATLSSLRTGDTTVLPALLSTGSGALGVTLALIEGTLPPPARAAAIAQGAALTDPLRRDLFERFLPEAQRRHVLGTTFNREALLARSGDATRGRAVFATVCVACHRLGDIGINFGPDLAHVGTKWDRAGLLEQMVAPSAVVDAVWELATVHLKDGGTKSGFITARDTTFITLRQAGGLTEKIPTAQIAKRSTTRTSVMPEGLLQNLTAPEAADLLEFLARLK
jgi:putative heme-binding domain-containing protein